MGKRLRWTGLPQSHTSASIVLSEASTDATFLNVAHPLDEADRHVFIWGTLGGATLQIEYTPDVGADDASTWFAPTALNFTAPGDTFFKARPAKFRIVVTGGDGTTDINVEIR